MLWRNGMSSDQNNFRCVFCGDSSKVGSVAHLIPDSLGGSLFGVLPNGVECSKCNQYFGSKIEKVVLNSWPLSVHRTWLNIPTKKGKPAKFTTKHGVITSSGKPREIFLDPSQEIHFNKQNKGTLEIVAEQSEFEAVMNCRWLVRLGLCYLVANGFQECYGDKYERARHFVRRPPKGMQWWFGIKISLEDVHEFWGKQLNYEDYWNNVYIRILKTDDIIAVDLNFFGIRMFAPLVHSIIRQEDFVNEANTRIRNITV